MRKEIKIKLLMVFILVITIGSITIKPLLTLERKDTTVKNYQSSIIKNISKEYKNDVKKSLDILFDEHNANDNSLNTSSNETENIETEKQESTNLNIEKSSNNNVATKVNNNSQSYNESININSEKKENTNNDLKVDIPKITYDRTTSIYANDNVTLLRVEYYLNNVLTYFSVVEQFNASTQSYIEKIYKCNRETNVNPLIRTDEYFNNKLIKSY